MFLCVSTTVWKLPFAFLKHFICAQSRKKKTNDVARGSSIGGERPRTTNDERKENKNLSCLPRPGVVGMQWLSSPGSVANYPLPNFIRRGKRRRAARDASRSAPSSAVRYEMSLGRRGRGHPGVRFPTPNLSYGKHKNCNEKRTSSRQSVTCGA